MRTLRQKRWIYLLLIGFLFLLFYNGTFLGKWIYPIEFKSEIQSNAERYDLDPFLIAAIIQVESKFNADIRSHKGAIGLMQLMPDTAEWLLEKEDFNGQSINQVSEPAINIQMGSWYLNYLNKLFSGNVNAVLAAYNAGHGNVSKWLDQGRWDGSYKNLESVPYGETRHYVQRVLYYYKKYVKIYSEEWHLQK